MVNINLLPRNLRKTSTGPSPWNYAAGALALATLLGIAIPELLFASQISQLRGQLSGLQGEITALTPAKQEFDKLQAEKTKLEQVTVIAQQLRDQKTYWSNDLSAFVAQMPARDSVALTNVAMKPVDPAATGAGFAGTGVARRIIEMDGKAKSPEAVVAVLNAYEKNPNFGVVFRNMNRVEADDGSVSYDFGANIGFIDPNATAGAAAGTAPAAGAPAAGAPTGGAPAPAPAAPAPSGVSVQ
ncbi:fimbrial assembly protein [Deinococcus lacus]|uniref:Fimbrial assembly protein n=1 Tax=Deinococcus lacus TaxID=392561 RepID=A0ABW1YD98_9DEIO